jgi:tetratricopeptide (TPR) repeat protein
LIHSLRGDLDWIVMKALEKDRTRRFETANGLAMDIQRYLHNEPVTARPPSTLYRFQKLVRRNKTAFAAVGAVAAALVIGLGLSLFLFIRERQALRRVEAAERQAKAGLVAEKELRVRSEIGKKYAEAGLMLSQGKWDEAQKIMDEVPPYQAAASIYSVLGKVQAIRKQWAAASTNYALVAQLLPEDSYAFHQLAALYLKMGDIEAYRRHCQKLMEKFGDTTDPNLAERTVKACLILPQPKVNMNTIDRLAQTAVSVESSHRDFPFFQFAKGLAEFRLGRFASAIDWETPVMRQLGDPIRAVQACMVLAMAQYRLNQHGEAQETLATGMEIAQRRMSGPDGPVPENRWNDWIYAHLLMAEAKAMVEAEPNAAANTK